MSIYNMLYPYQKNIVDQFCDRKSFGLFLDMGCGKTPVSLALAEQNACTKIIIISINAKALETEKIGGSFAWWLKKSNRNYNIYNKNTVFETKRLPDPIKNHAHMEVASDDAFIINYESLYVRAKDRQQKVQLRDNLMTFIESCEGRNVAIIVDESHKMKDTNSMQTMAINKIRALCENTAHAVYSYLLTGTPFTRGFIDLYSQLKFLGCTLSKGSFVDMFCIKGHYPSLADWQQPIIGYKNVDQLFRLVHQYAITIKSEEVVKLPEQVFIDHVTPQTDSLLLFTLQKLRPEKINKELLSRGVATIYNKDFDKFSSEEKINYINNTYHINATIDMNGTISCNGQYLGKITDKFSSILFNMRLCHSQFLEGFEGFINTPDLVPPSDRGGAVNNPFYRNIAYPSLNWLADTSASFWMRTRQLSVGFQGNEEEAKWYDYSRLDALEKLLADNVDNYVLFYNFTPEFIELYQICDKLGYKIDVYNGIIKSLTFYDEFTKLSEGDKLVDKGRIILANFASGSTGVNWQAYNKCILFSIPVFRDYSQGIKRVHRIGQKDTVFYHIFKQNNWLDKSMWDALTECKEYDKDLFEADLQRVQSMMEDE